MYIYDEEEGSMCLLRGVEIEKGRDEEVDRQKERQVPSRPRGFFRSCAAVDQRRTKEELEHDHSTSLRRGCLASLLLSIDILLVSSSSWEQVQWGGRMVRRMSGRERKVGSPGTHSVANAGNPSQGQDQSVNPIQSAEGLAPCTTDDTFTNLHVVRLLDFNFKGKSLACFKNSFQLIIIHRLPKIRKL